MGYVAGYAATKEAKERIKKYWCGGEEVNKKIIAVTITIMLALSSLAILAYAAEPLFSWDFETDQETGYDHDGKFFFRSGSSGYVTVTQEAARNGVYGINFTCTVDGWNQMAMFEAPCTMPREVYTGCWVQFQRNLPANGTSEIQFITVGDLESPPDYISNKAMAVVVTNAAQWRIDCYNDTGKYQLTNGTVELNVWYYLVTHSIIADEGSTGGLCELYVHSAPDYESVLVCSMSINNSGRYEPSSCLFGERGIWGSNFVEFSILMDDVIISAGYPYPTFDVPEPTVTPEPTATPTPEPSVTPEPDMSAAEWEEFWLWVTNGSALEVWRSLT